MDDRLDTANFPVSLIVVAIVMVFVFGFTFGVFMAGMTDESIQPSVNATGIPNIVVNIEQPSESSYNFSDKEVAIYNVLSKQYEIEFVDIGWDANDLLKVYIYSRDKDIISNSDEVFSTVFKEFPDADLYYIIKDIPDTRVIVADETQMRLGKFPVIVHYGLDGSKLILPIRNYR